MVIDFLKNELSEFPFDSEVELVILSKHDLISAINNCLNAEISQNELTEWANILEVRDDVGFDSIDVQEHIFDLSSPEINGTLNNEKLKNILVSLSKKNFNNN